MKKVFYKLFIIPGIIIFLFNPVSAQWGGWDWQREVTISKRSGSLLTDFQVKIDLSGLTPTFDFAHANGDGSDLRIADSTEVTEIPFWIENWDSTAQEATIWVKVPSIPVSGDESGVQGNTAARGALAS